MNDNIQTKITGRLTPCLHMCIIIDVLMASVMEYFHITEARLEEFTASFVQHLPQICRMH